MPKNSLFKQLTSTSSIQAASLYKQAKRVVYTSCFEVRRADKIDLNQTSKFLLIIPRKVGTAPERNLLRRQIKHIIFEEKLYISNHNWIIFVRPPAKHISFEEIKAFLKTWLVPF